MKPKKIRDDAKILADNIALVDDKQLRKWLIQVGHQDRLDYTDNELVILKDCFLSLDDDCSGSIGVDELV